MPVTMSADAEVKAETLRVTYRVVNDSDDTIHVLNIIERWTAAGLSSDPNTIYTEVSDGVLRLSKANLAIPEHLDVESPEVPLLTPVAGGTAFGEDLVLDLPLTACHPYDEVVPSDDVVTYDVVELAIGWLPPEVDVRTGIRPDGTQVTSAAYDDIVRSQQLLVTHLPVAVPTHLVPRSGA